MSTPTVINFFASGIPKGQPRPKAFARNFGAKWQARVYDPGTADGWKYEVGMAAKQWHGARLQGPISVTIYFYLPRPKAHFGKKNGQEYVKTNSPTFHAGKPDADNLAKAVLDALTNCGVWGDDSQISALSIIKTYVCEKKPVSGAAVTINQLFQTTNTTTENQ
jgi:Holliday junction resolvase RusA-like endonuclease